MLPEHGQPWLTTDTITLPAYEFRGDDIESKQLLHAHQNRIRKPIRTTPSGWCNSTAARPWSSIPPALPLTQAEMDRVYGLPYTRQPHPSYGREKIPAYDVVKHSVQIMRGCFGGCTFCCITAHEGRIIQSRSQESVLAEIEQMRGTSPISPAS